MTDKKENKAKEKKRILKMPKIRKEKPKTDVGQALSRDPYDILKFALMTEKAVRMVEAQNKLAFIVDRGAGKSEIKSAAESAFNTKVSSVKTMIGQDGRKKAFIKFEKPGEAGEIAIRLGII